MRIKQQPSLAPLATNCSPARSRTLPQPNTKGYSSTYLAMGFANVRAGTRAGTHTAIAQRPVCSLEELS